MENRRQLDDKAALVKELNMTHKLHEAEDAHIIAELRQRVAALEVQIQELVTAGQLNYNSEKTNYDLYKGSSYGLNSYSASTDKLADFNDDMKYMLLMSSTASLVNPTEVSGKSNFRTKSTAETTPSTPTTPSVPVKTLKNGMPPLMNKTGADMSSSTSLISLPNSTAAAAAFVGSPRHAEDKLNSSLDEKSHAYLQNGMNGGRKAVALNRSQSSDEAHLITQTYSSSLRESGTSNTIKENGSDQPLEESDKRNVKIDNDLESSES